MTNDRPIQCKQISIKVLININKPVSPPFPPPGHVNINRPMRKESSRKKPRQGGIRARPSQMLSNPRQKFWTPRENSSYYLMGSLQFSCFPNAWETFAGKNICCRWGKHSHLIRSIISAFTAVLSAPTDKLLFRPITLLEWETDAKKICPWNVDSVTKSETFHSRQCWQNKASHVYEQHKCVNTFNLIYCGNGVCNFGRVKNHFVQL